MNTVLKEKKEQYINEISILTEKLKKNELNIQYLSNLVIQLNNDLAYSRDQLIHILNSFRWKLSGFLLTFLEVFHIKSILVYVYQTIRKMKGKKDYSPSLNNLQELKSIKETSTIYDVYPYNNVRLLKDISVKVIDKDFQPTSIKIRFSIVTPVWNEAEGILDFLQSVKDQTLRPDEIVFTDGGSTDNTVELIEQFSLTSPFKVTVIKEKRIPIATGRNLAIKKTRNAIIVMADAGTILHKNYCLNLIGCFHQYKKVDLVGGVWFPIKSSSFTQSFIPDWDRIVWKTWLTSTRAMAFRKSLAKRIGYFPEHVFYGDDTLFGVNYRRVSKYWMFNKKAITFWDAPFTEQQFEKTSRNYGLGDGENGLGEYFYHSNLLHSKKTDLPIKISPVRENFLEGYLEGRMNRGKIEIHLRKIKGVIIFLTQVPVYEDVQSKVLKKIQQLIKKNYKVVCVHSHPNLIELYPKAYLDLDYTLLEMYYLTDFDFDEFLVRYPKKLITIKIIADHSRIFKNLLSRAKKEHIAILASKL